MLKLEKLENSICGKWKCKVDLPVALIVYGDNREEVLDKMCFNLREQLRMIEKAFLDANMLKRNVTKRWMTKNEKEK